MKEHFIAWQPQLKAVSLLKEINTILAEYEALGYKLTLRQLYYQLVSRDIIANNVKEYTTLGDIASRGRLAGYIDWSMIEDRVRIPSINTHWEHPSEIVQAAADSFYMSKWKDQSYYIEVWCEKDAVSNIIEPVCRKWDVTFMANRGYSSQTAMYDAFKRLAAAAREDKKIGVLYLGDHDPSGIDMTFDIMNRLGNFIFHDKERRFEGVVRLALNMNQIDEYQPPENPAKVTDSRYKKYAEVYGESSWELDALEPTVLSELVEKAILEFVDQEKFDAVVEEETKHRDKIIELVEGLK